MKRTKKILSLALCAVLLVAGTVATTVAYLTSTTEVVNNTFTVGNVEITLDEAYVTEYGKPVTGSWDDSDKDKVVDEREITGDLTEVTNPTGALRVIANEYKLIPSHNYVKDPTIHVGPTTNSENVLLFTKVENGLAEIEAATTIENQMLEKGWKKLGSVENVWYWAGDKNNETGIPVAVADGTDVGVFDEFTLTSDADVSTYVDATITIEAYAVQADGFDGKTAAEVWTAAPLAAWN